MLSMKAIKVFLFILCKIICIILYKGLVNGDDYIKEMSWNDVAQIISIGGTTIGTARCAAFRERSGRLLAARNMVSKGINSLIVIGGDGSLTGAELLRQEWPSLMKELEELKNDQGQYLSQFSGVAFRYPSLYIAGLVGSIDNDMCGTEWTIGADTSLHRILEAIDAISTSAISHQRIFIIEVMGRHCGWLALMAAVSCGADWCFIPEVPSNSEGFEWQQKMCSTIQHNRTLGRRLSVIIVSEGAIDQEGHPITSKDVQVAISTQLHLEARITVLGHLQRGGSPSAYDRILATLQGIEAMQVILGAANHPLSTRKSLCASQLGETSPIKSQSSYMNSCSVLVGVRENKICRLDLTECVNRTRSVGEAYAARDFEKVFQLRDPDFKAIYRHYHNYITKSTLLHLNPASTSRRVAIFCVGAPSGGMNACVAAITRACLLQGNLTPIGIMDGLSTLKDEKSSTYNNVKEFSWMDVDGWISKGGTLLGTHRTVPSSTQEAFDIWAALTGHTIKANALIIIGGYEAFLTTRLLDSTWDAFQAKLSASTSTLLLDGLATKFPMVCVPATISNNVPGTEFSLGSDTALNMITQSCDIIRLSAASTKRVFCVEVQGGRCGYLAQLGAIASAATYSYLPEEGITLTDISRECDHLKERFSDDKKDGRLVLVNEHASSVFQAEYIAKIFQVEGRPSFDARSCKLGHLQQGGAPSPRDRILGLRYGKMAVDYLAAFFQGSQPPADFEKSNRMLESLDSFVGSTSARAVLVGIQNGAITFSDVHQLATLADDSRRVCKKPWWLVYRPYAKVLSKYT